MRCSIFFLAIFFSRLLSASPFVWVVNNGNSTVTVIDSATNTVVTNISAVQGNFDSPYPIAFTPDGKFAYIANFNPTPSVSVIDTSTYQLAASIPLTGASLPYYIAITPNGDFAYIVNNSSNSVSIINTSTNTLATTLAAGFNFNSPYAIAFSNDGSSAYVVNEGGDNITLINTANNTFVSTISSNVHGTFVNPLNIVVAPNGQYAYVSNFQKIIILSLTSNMVSGSISLPASADAYGIAFSSDGSTAYVADIDNWNVYVVNTSNNTFSTINDAQGMLREPVYLTLAGNDLYVTNLGNNNVSVISAASPYTLVELITTLQGNFIQPYFIATQPIPNQTQSGERPFLRPSNRRPR